MAERVKTPKKMMGYKIPKALRKSSVINGMLANDAGRQIVAAALLSQQRLPLVLL